LRIDCRSLQTEHVPIPSGARVLVLDSAEIDTLAEIAVRAPGVFGARLTGAGFGGCVVALAAADSADFALSAIVERYGQVTGLPGTGFAAAASGGTHIRWTAGQ
jgi:galactokinase